MLRRNLRFFSWSWQPVMNRLIQEKHMNTTSQWLTEFLRTCCLLLLWSGRKPHGNHMALWSTSSCTEIARWAEGRDCFWAVYFVSHIFSHSRVLCLKNRYLGMFWVHWVKEKSNLKHLQKVGEIFTLVSKFRNNLSTSALGTLSARIEEWWTKDTGYRFLERRSSNKFVQWQASFWVPKKTRKHYRLKNVDEEKPVEGGHVKYA